MSDPEEHDREIKRHEALEILKNNGAALGEEPRELSPEVAKVQNFYLDGLMALSSQEWKTRQRLHSGILAHLYKPEPDYKKFRDEASKVLCKKNVEVFRENIILQTQILIEQREANENRPQKNATRRNGKKKNDNSEERKHNIEEFQPRLIRVPSDIRPDDCVASDEGDNDVSEPMQLAEVIMNPSNYNPVSAQSDEIMNDQWDYDPASPQSGDPATAQSRDPAPAQSDEVTMTGTKDYDPKPTRSQARNSTSLAATSQHGPRQFTLRSGKQYKRDGNGKQLNGRGRLPTKKIQKASIEKSQEEKNDKNQQQSSNENNRKRKAVDSNISLSEASHDDTLPQLRKIKESRHTPKKKLKLLTNQNGFNSISQPNRKRFNFTKENIMKSASTWSSPITLVSGLRTAIKYFSFGEYEKYHLHMISLILRACQCTKKEELDNIQQNLPGTISTMSIPVFNYLRKNAIEDDREDFSKMIYLDFPADAGREDQKRYFELWRSVLHENHPASGTSGQIFPNLDDDRINMVDIYKKVAMTEEAMIYREIIRSMNLDEDKEWLYDLQRRLVNKVLHTAVSLLDVQDVPRLNEGNGSTLDDQDLDRQSSRNGEAEWKQTFEFHFGSLSMLELSDNATLLFKTAQRAKEKLKEQEENLKRERIEMKANLQTERDKMKKDMENTLNRMMEDALDRMIDDVKMGAAEGDQRRNGEINLYPVEGSEDTEDAEETNVFAVPLNETLNQKIQDIQQEKIKLYTRVVKLENDSARLASELKRAKENNDIVEKESKEIIENIMSSFDKELIDENLENRCIEGNIQDIPQRLRMIQITVRIYQESMHKTRSELKETREKTARLSALGETVTALHKRRNPNKDSSLSERPSGTKSIVQARFQDAITTDKGIFTLEPTASLQRECKRVLEAIKNDLEERNKSFLNLRKGFEALNEEDPKKQALVSEMLSKAMDSIVQGMRNSEVAGNTSLINSGPLNEDSTLLDVSTYINKINATEGEMLGFLEAIRDHCKQYEAKAQQFEAKAQKKLEANVQNQMEENLKLIREILAIGPEAMQALGQGDYTYQQMQEQIHALSHGPHKSQSQILQQKRKIVYMFGDWKPQNDNEAAYPNIYNSEQRSHLLNNMKDEWGKVNTTEVSGLWQNEWHDELKSENYCLDRLFDAITSLVELLGDSIERVGQLQFSSSSLEGSLTFLWEALGKGKERDKFHLSVDDQMIWKERFTNYCQEQRWFTEQHRTVFISLCGDIDVLIQSRNDLKSSLQIFAKSQWKLNHQVVKVDLAGFIDRFSEGGLVAKYFESNECNVILENMHYFQDIWPSNGLLEIDETVILQRRQFEEARKPPGEAEEAAKWMALAQLFQTVNYTISETGQGCIYGGDPANLPWQPEDSVLMKIEKINVFFLELLKMINESPTNGRMHVPPHHTMEENTRQPTSSGESDPSMRGMRSDRPDHGDWNAGGDDARATDQTADEGTEKMATSQINEATQRDLISKIENALQQFLSAKDIFVFNSAWLERMLRERDANILKELREHQTGVTGSLHEFVTKRLPEHQASLVRELREHYTKSTEMQVQQYEAHITKTLLEHQIILLKDLQKHDAKLTEVQLQNYDSSLIEKLRMDQASLVEEMRQHDAKLTEAQLQNHQARLTEELLTKLLEHQDNLTKELRSDDAKLTEVQLQNYQKILAEELQNHQTNMIKELQEHRAGPTEALRQPDAHLIEDLLQRYNSSLIDKLQNHQTNLMGEVLQKYQARLSEPQPKLDFISKLEQIATELSQRNIQLLQLPSDMKIVYEKLLNRVESREKEEQSMIKAIRSEISSCLKINNSHNTPLRTNAEWMEKVQPGQLHDPKVIEDLIELNEKFKKDVMNVKECIPNPKLNEPSMDAASLDTLVHTLMQGNLDKYLTCIEYAQYYLNYLQNLQSKQEKEEVSRLRILNIWANWLANNCSGSKEDYAKLDINNLREKVEKNQSIEEILKIECSMESLEEGPLKKSFLNSIRKTSAHNSHTEYLQVYWDLFKIILSVKNEYSMAQEKIIYLESKNEKAQRKQQAGLPNLFHEIFNDPVSQEIPETSDTYSNIMMEAKNDIMSRDMSTQTELPLSDCCLLCVDEIQRDDPLERIFSAIKIRLATFIKDTDVDTSTEALCFEVVANFLQSVNEQCTRQQRKCGCHELPDINQNACHVTVEGLQFEVLGEVSHRGDRLILMQIEKWEAQKYGCSKYRIMTPASIFSSLDYQLMEDNAQALYEFYLSDPCLSMMDIPDPIRFKGLSEMYVVSQGCSFIVEYRGEKPDDRKAASTIERWGAHVMLAMKNAGLKAHTSRRLRRRRT